MSTPEEHMPPAPPIPPPAASADGIPNAEERQWAMFTHLSALLGGFLTAGWGCFAGPLIIWLLKKDTMPFVDDQGKEALNFNITVAIVSVALFMLTLVTFGIGLIIALPVGIVVGISWLVFTIIATVKANEGERYRYPFTLRLIK
jgi:uncharacterized Tic20 family protein